VDLTAPYLDSARDLLTDRITRVKESDRINLRINSQLTKLEGYHGNFTATLSGAPGGATVEETVKVGSVIVCTGYKEFDAARITHYGYGKLPNVITSFEFEQMLRAGRIQTKEGKTPPTWPSSTASAAGARSSMATARASAA